MKTPREFLLDRHKAATPRLDQIRQRIIDRLDRRGPSFAVKLWEELILPARRAWICLAGAWVIVLTLNLMAGGETSVRVNEQGPMNSQSLLALQRQEHLMARLIQEDKEPLSPAKAPEKRPRSEARVKQKIV